MATLDLISAGLTSVRQGQNRISGAASDIARAALPVDPVAATAQPATGQAAASTPVETARPVNLVDSLVELQQGRQQAEVGASVIDTADEVLGTLLDVTA
jgi:negative regulator of replication initiation